jgi:hypothetical protein
LFNSFIIKSALKINNFSASYLATHGDDTDLELPSILHAQILIQTIANFGFKINPNKTAMGSSVVPNTEFLKTYFLQDKVLAYSS